MRLSLLSYLCIFSITSCILCFCISKLYIFFFSVDNLVKQWAPLVWLAPGEKFLPLDVNEFLDNVHVHHEQPTDPQIEDDIEWELHNTISSRIIYTAQDEEDQEADTNRQRRTSNSFSPNSDLFDQLPSGSSSKRSYLVTNGNIGMTLNKNCQSLEKLQFFLIR